MAFILRPWIWDTNTNLPAASYMYNVLRLNPRTSGLCLMKFRFEGSSSSQLDLLSAERTGMKREQCIWQRTESRPYLITYRHAIRMCMEHNPMRLWRGRDPKPMETTRSLSIGFDCFLYRLHNTQDYLWAWRQNIGADRGQEHHSRIDNRIKTNWWAQRDVKRCLTG